MASHNTALLKLTTALVALACLYMHMPATAATTAMPPTTNPPLDLTEMTADTVNQLKNVCDLVKQIEMIAAMNVSNYSPNKQIQLQAIQITGGQVRENACDWMSAMHHIDVLEDSSCSGSKLHEVCERVKQHVDAAPATTAGES